MACTSESISLRISRESNRRVPLGERLAKAWYTVERWRERARQRRELLALDERMLRDIGISRTDADRIGHTPFWKP